MSPGRQRITDEAARLFVERGYAETTLRDIAGAAGIKAGSVYYHFDSKDDLLVEVLQHGMAVMVDAFSEVAERSAERSALERLEAHVLAHLEALHRHGPYTTTHVTTFHYVPAGVRSEIVPLRDGYERLWTDLLSELAAAGEVAPKLDVNMARLALMGAMNATAAWFDSERGDIAAVATSLAQQFWHGVSTAHGHPGNPTDKSSKRSR